MKTPNIQFYITPKVKPNYTLKFTRIFKFTPGKGNYRQIHERNPNF